MTRKRFEFSTRKGDVLMGATFTIAQLRNQYTENGGQLTARHRRYLGHFVPAYLSDGTGNARRFAITITRDEALENMPAGLRTALRPHFERADRDWFAARPWIGNEDNAIPQSAINNEFGLVLGDDEEPSKWEDGQ